MFLARPLLLVLLLAGPAWAQRDTSREALSRLEETVAHRISEGGLTLTEISPAIVVSVKPAFEETKTWYPTAALATLARVFGGSAMRSCEACMTPRLFAEADRVEENTEDLSTAEITRLDDGARGASAPAKVAIWLDETEDGVSLRVIDLRNSHIVLAQNFDPLMREAALTKKNYSFTQELDRRARGDALAHVFFDATLYPGQHLSVDWSEQWGDSNRNLSGVTVSIFDPLLGLGANYYRVIPVAFNIMVGIKVIMSIPTALVSAISKTSTTVIDPLLTGVFIARYPIGTSNYGIEVSASTSGRVGVGLSLMNFSFLPLLP